MDFLKKYLFSTRLMAILFLLFAVSMALGTFIESWYSTETARIWIYNTSWFEAIMVFFTINFIGNIFKYKLLRRDKWAVLLLHLSWILIIIGAFVTRYISFEGRMPIREGETEKVFYSDKSFITLLVDGDKDGSRARRSFQDEILVTPEALKSSLPWEYDFNGRPFKVSFVSFKEGVKKGIVHDPNGAYYIKIVESSGGGRHDHYIKEGEVVSVHNLLFSFNKEIEGAINFSMKGGDYRILSPFEGSFLRMADQFSDQLPANSYEPLQLRSLYQVAGVQFVIPEAPIQGKEGVVKAAASNNMQQSLNALTVLVETGGVSKEITVLGQKGSTYYSEEVSLNGLDFTLGFGSKVYELPFEIRLNDFIAEKYPGTQKSYASFMSKITVMDQRPFDYDIYMNHVLDHKGYRFFQASFDPDEKGTVLSVNHDRWGTGITYLGYFMLYIGMIGIFFYGNTRFKTLAKSLNDIKAKKTLLSWVLIMSTLGMVHAQELEHEHEIVNQEELLTAVKESMVSEEHAASFGYLVIQDDNGRMKPINTFSSELLRKLSYKDKFNGYRADQVFISMQLNPALWYNVEFIALDKQGKNDSLRKIIGIPKGKRMVKATDFFDENGSYKLAPYLEEAYKTNTPNQFQKDFKTIDLKLGLLNRALGGDIVKVFPLPNDENNKWISAIEYRSGSYQVSDSLYGNFIKNGFPYYLMSLRNSIETGDYSESNKVLEAIKLNQRTKGEAVIPTASKIDAEIRYNKADPFNKLYRYNLLFGMLMFFVLIFQIFKDRKIYRYSIQFFKWIIWASFIVHTLALAARWYISGHAPWSDAYESILYVAWATLGMGLWAGRKSHLTIAAATFVTSMLMWIAHQSWVDPSIANLQPVLDSYWLMIHVAIIVGSYGPLTVGMILGIVSMILMVLTNQKNRSKMDLNIKELTVINELALTIGLVMLTIGNFLGGMWANESWGRYWGWDPKETWALISIMVYAFVIHARMVPGLRGKWTFNFMSVLAYSSIMMTYFGVNFYLVGLHSYASGEQVITPSFIWYTLFSVFILGGVSWWRYQINFKK